MIYILYQLITKITLKLRKIKCGKKTIIRFPLSFKGSNKNKISLGNNCFIGQRCRLYSYGGVICIGNNFNAQRDLSICSAEKITVGDNVLIGSYVLINDNNHYFEPGQQWSIKSSPITIGNNVWIAEKAMILKGVTIGDYCMIGAGSVVTHDIPSYSIAVGNPAKVIKKFNFETNKWEKQL